MVTKISIIWMESKEIQGSYLFILYNKIYPTKVKLQPQQMYFL